MKDKLGKDLQKGQVVDVFVSDIVSAYVMEVQEGGIVGADGRPQPPTLYLNVAIPMRIGPTGVAPVYIVRESDKPKVAQVM